MLHFLFHKAGTTAPDPGGNTIFLSSGSKPQNVPEHPYTSPSERTTRKNDDVSARHFL